MKPWLDRLLRPRVPSVGPPPLDGLHAYRTTLGGVHARVHLRGEPDGTALALINASCAVRLTQSGAAMTRMLLQGHSDAAIVAALRKQFVGAQALESDLAELRETLARLAGAAAGRYPIEDLTDERSARASAMSAPLAAWLEMAAPDTMIARLDALWAAAVPHVTLLPTADTPLADLLRAVERAEDLGMICGLRALGSALPPETVAACAEAGVDCVQVPLLSVEAPPHDALLGSGEHAAALLTLQACQRAQVCAVIEVPLIEPTVDALAALAEAAQSHGVATLALWALVRDEGQDEPAAALAAGALLQLGEDAEELSESGTTHVLWAPPVHACGVVAEHVRAGPRSPGDAAIRVATDGRVWPPRGDQSAGTLGDDPWPSIWQHAAFRTLRIELADDHRCGRCPDLAQCSTECPLQASMWARGASA